MHRLSVTGPRPKTLVRSVSIWSMDILKDPTPASADSVLPNDQVWMWSNIHSLRESADVKRRSRVTHHRKRVRPLPPTPAVVLEAAKRDPHHRYSKPLPSIPVSEAGCSKGKARAAASSSDHDGRKRRLRRLPTVPLLIPLSAGSSSTSQSTGRRDLPTPPPLLVVTPTTQPCSSTLCIKDGRATPLDETPLCSEIDWDVVMDEILHRFSSVSSLNVNIIEEETPSLARSRKSNYASMMYKGTNSTLNGLIDMHLLHV
ncbi:hypothetical protein CPB85DRAFT_253053 [Mucidula mucida]|nr:hypothetical protein CPB85DRAFT_253053 [Mucidula mucida]